MLDIVKQAAEMVREASDRNSGIAKLAAILGVSRTALYLWKRVPAERVLALEAATQGKLPRHLIRPDIYPPGLSVANDNLATVAPPTVPANSNHAPQVEEAEPEGGAA